MAVHETDAIGLGTELGLQAALQGLVLILAPHRACGAGVADEPRILHGAERQRMIAATEETIDLDGRLAVARNNCDVAHGAASNPPGSWLRAVVDSLVDWVQRHVLCLAPRAPMGVTTQARRAATRTSMTPSYHARASTVRRRIEVVGGRLAGGCRPLRAAATQL